MNAMSKAAGTPNAGAECPARCGAEEWVLRQQLAATYHVFDHLGWIESIFNHITVRVPGPEKHYLINPFGLNYNEITALNLIKIDIDGKALSPTEYPVNRAGFIIHSAVHDAREDAHCVIQPQCRAPCRSLVHLRRPP